MNVNIIHSFADVDGDLDVDGHTNLDNVSIAGITTISNDLIIESTNPAIVFKDTNGHPDYNINCEGGTLRFNDSNGNNRILINVDGHIDISENLDVSKDLDVDGHTNLDNVSIAGVSTFSDDVTFTGASYDIVFDQSNNRIRFNEWCLNQYFGNSSEMRIYYGIGSGHTNIVNSTGNLNFHINRKQPKVYF